MSPTLNLATTLSLVYLLFVDIVSPVLLAIHQFVMGKRPEDAGEKPVAYTKKMGK